MDILPAMMKAPSSVGDLLRRGAPWVAAGGLVGAWQWASTEVKPTEDCVDFSAAEQEELNRGKQPVLLPVPAPKKKD